MNGFKINSIRVIGEDVEDAVLLFEKGINLLTGPSDTGKTYLVQCIDYMFGKKESPKRIKESEKYESIVMEIEDYNSGSISTLLRSMNESKMYFYKDIPYENIKHSDYLLIGGKKDRETVSDFFLRLFGFSSPVEISKNESFEKDNFSIRNFARYMIVEEESMISKHSPVHINGSFTEKTKNRNIFKFLITGIDDSNFQKQEKKEIWSAKKMANIELLEELLNQENDKYRSLLEEIDTYKSLAIENDEPIMEEIKYYQEQIILLNNELNNIEDQKRKINNELIYNENLRYKFDLLKEQYKSDIERLKFIDEGSFLLGQLNVITCPHCGEKIESYQEHKHKGIDVDIDEMNNACELEIIKTEKNILELEKSYSTILDIDKELVTDLSTADLKIFRVRKELEEVLRPQLIDLEEKWSSKTEYEILKSSIVSIEENIKNINEMILTNQTRKHISSTSNKEQVIQDLNDSRFPDILSNNLKQCLFDIETDLHIVFFLANNEVEFSINGNNRSNFGKGYRAIITSLFYLSLLMYCREERKPHSNLIILDSPLNAFEEKERNITEGSSDIPIEKIKTRFFEFLTENFQEEQIIVIENIDALSYVNEHVHVLKFTKDLTNGRYGFF